MANEHIATEAPVTIGGKVYVLTAPKIKDVQSVVVFLQKKITDKAKAELVGLPPELQKITWEEAREKARTITLDTFISAEGIEDPDTFAFLFWVLARKNHPEITPDTAMDVLGTVDDFNAVIEAIRTGLMMANGQNPTAAAATT